MFQEAYDLNDPVAARNLSELYDHYYPDQKFLRQ